MVEGTLRAYRSAIQRTLAPAAAASSNGKSIAPATSAQKTRLRGGSQVMTAPSLQAEPEDLAVEAQLS
jgi:hypothetical protein